MKGVKSRANGKEKGTENIERTGWKQEGVWQKKWEGNIQVQLTILNHI